MLLRRYGSKIQSVETNFDPNALTEIGFTRTSDLAETAEEFLETHEKIGEREITGRHEGDVKTEVESALLEDLLAQLRAIQEESGPDTHVLVENQAGTDHPKLRDRTTGKVVSGENRFHFEYTVDPPIRVGLYRKRA